MKNTLIINAHQPYPFSEGKLNALLVERAKSAFLGTGKDVKVTTMT